MRHRTSLGVDDASFLTTLMCDLDQVVCGTTGTPTATVHLVGPDGEKRVGFSTGTGPVDAAYKAVDSIVQVGI